MVSDPGEAVITLPLNGDAHVDFHYSKSVVLPNMIITRLNPFILSVYGLSARCPTLKTDCYQSDSKDSLPGGWPAFRGGVSSR